MCYRQIIDADLFDDVESLLASSKIIDVIKVKDPRFVGDEVPLGPERKECKVTVGHVAVLGVDQKLPHDRKLRVAVNDHCGIHTAYVI